MRNLKTGGAAVLVLFSILVITASASAGSIFVTGHDPVWHSHFGGNVVGATNLATAGIDYARAGSSLPFLFIESKTVAVPGGNAREAAFLTPDLGYVASAYVVMDAAGLAALPDFRSALNAYSAIVVASDHGGMLTSAELSFLNAHAADMISFINAGGGLFAAAESNAAGLIGATPRFGFLPFLVSSTDFGTFESGNTVTAFGAGLGLTNSDVNGNFSHNYFASTGGMTPVDLFNGIAAQPLTLAFTGTIDETGVVPEPATILLLSSSLVGVAIFGRRRSRHTR